mgnify:CR=1 FL=1
MANRNAGIAPGNSHTWHRPRWNPASPYQACADAGIAPSGDGLVQPIPPAESAGERISLSSTRLSAASERYLARDHDSSD